MRASSVILVRGRRSETFYVDQDSVNENIDEDMHSPNAIAIKTRGISPWKSELVGDELALDHLHGDEDSDEEHAGEDEVGSEMEDQRSEFNYGELEEHVIVNDDEDGDEDDLDENDFGAEDREKAADNEDDYIEY
ncbi:hypothetical protein M405DRAFT_930177 [Rhizopogon salebrosus TDB-379]|nr:hypothetical protein M405DRAFT_930177 [Rhizopogon salebrosus TDB-379]